MPKLPYAQVPPKKMQHPQTTIRPPLVPPKKTYPILNSGLLLLLVVLEHEYNPPDEDLEVGGGLAPV